MKESGASDDEDAAAAALVDVAAAVSVVTADTVAASFVGAADSAAVVSDADVDVDGRLKGVVGKKGSASAVRAGVDEPG